MINNFSEKEKQIMKIIIFELRKRKRCSDFESIFELAPTFHERMKRTLKDFDYVNAPPYNSNTILNNRELYEKEMNSMVKYWLIDWNSFDVQKHQIERFKQPINLEDDELNQFAQELSLIFSNEMFGK